MLLVQKEKLYQLGPEAILLKCREMNAEALQGQPLPLELIVDSLMQKLVHQILSTSLICRS